MEELLHFFRLAEKHFLFQALDKGVDVGCLGSVDFEQVEDSVFEVFNF